MQNILFIACGGAVGAVCRYLLAGAINNAAGAGFPWGTMFVNLTGSFVIGLLAEVFDILIMPSFARPLILIGFLGAYTTFSTFTLETFKLLQDGEIRFAVINMLISNISGIAFVIVGIISARLLLNLFK